MDEINILTVKILFNVKKKIQTSNASSCGQSQKNIYIISIVNLTISVNTLLMVYFHCDKNLSRLILIYESFSFNHLVTLKGLHKNLFLYNSTQLINFEFGKVFNLKTNDYPHLRDPSSTHQKNYTVIFTNNNNR